MRWKTKAAIQNAVALLPSALSYALYYQLQRQFGGLRRFSPLERLAGAAQTWQRILEQGLEPRGRVFFEVGTGWFPLVPVGYWLMGADRTITVDVNPYLKAELMSEALQFMRTHEDAVSRLFGNLLQRERLLELMRLPTTGPSWLERLFALCGIEYRCPCDAGDTGLLTASVDFHTSFTVFEHIPPDVLSRILLEGTRIVRPGGLFVHMIDYSDHFSHADSSISAINFLQYSDAEWARYAGNRYMYMNRLRHDDMLSVFDAAGHTIVATVEDRDDAISIALRNRGMQLDERFRTKSPGILGIRGAWVVSRSSPDARQLSA